MEISIFPILSTNPVNQKTYNGTGFLIDGDGHFCTAGHNFFKIERGSGIIQKLDSSALINKQLLALEIIHCEYDPDNDIIKKDFAFGKIESLPSNPNSIKINSDNPVAVGYTTKNLEFQKLNTLEWEGIEYFLYAVPISIGTKSTELIQNIILTIDNVLFYTTGLNFDLNGFSGGPIIHNDKILGVLVSNCFITEEYIEKIISSTKTVE